jgi:pimeloyl-ACP methyl ester carboxylesterase
MLTSADRTKIGYTVTGSGPAVILVDGAMCYRGFGPSNELAQLLAPRFTVHTYDRRGRGESGGTSPWAVDREIEDLAAVIEAAGGSAYVYGLSSGAVLAMLAARAGLPVPKLALFEPPLPDEFGPGPGLTDELITLLTAGRRGDAVAHFQTAVGIPPETTAGMREQPFWGALEALAHTLVYDTTITGSLPDDQLPTITTPTLVVASDGSSPFLLSAARRVGRLLPYGQLVTLPGAFHGVPLEDLAPLVGDFLLAE